MTIRVAPIEGSTLPFQRRGSRIAGPATWAFATVTAAIAALFPATLGDMARIWTSSSSYHHGLLVGPVCLWLALRRRRFTPPAAAEYFALMPLAACAITLLIGRAIEAAILEHIGFVGLIISAAILAYGWTIARQSSLILVLMAMLIPFGESALPALKFLTTEGSRALLALASIPASIDANIITTETGRYAVADGCAGLNFLLASILTAIVIADIALTGFAQRVGFLVFAMAAAIIANIVRVSSIIAITTLSGGTIKLAADHLGFGLAVHIALILTLVEIGRSIASRAKAASTPVRPSAPTPTSQARYDHRPAVAALALIATASSISPAVFDRMHVFSLPGHARGVQPG